MSGKAKTLLDLYGIYTIYPVYIINRQPEVSLQELARCALRADSIQVAEVMCKWAAEVDWGCYQFWQER